MAIRKHEKTPETGGYRRRPDVFLGPSRGFAILVRGLIEDRRVFGMAKIHSPVILGDEHG